MKNKLILALFLILFMKGNLNAADDFFTIASIKPVKTEPADKQGVWFWPFWPSSEAEWFVPCLEVKLQTKESTDPRNTYVRAYFYDQDGKLIESFKTPSKSGDKDYSAPQCEMPMAFVKGQTQRVFFQMPKILQNKRAAFKVVVVFGDKDGATAVGYPENTALKFDYADKQLVESKSLNKIVRVGFDIAPVMEYIGKTRSPLQPQITFFIRTPKGVTKPSEIKGVIAICVLATNVGVVRNEMQKPDMAGDYHGLFPFADSHKLAVIAWGSTPLWDPTRSYDELKASELHAMDKTFDEVAAGWDNAIKEIAHRYELPDNNFLLWGQCGSAQWAHRLCLRKPDRFLAIFIHIPGSFDVPTPEASKVIWCLTTGEEYGGYDNSRRFYDACKALGYPMLYKAIVGLDHRHPSSPDVEAMMIKFFEYALTQKNLRIEHDKALGNDKTKTPWPEAFKHPSYYGDIVNQEMFPADQVSMIPEKFQVALPNKEIADIWAHSK